MTTFIRKEDFSVSFGCKFSLSSENLLYQVYWSIGGNYQQNFTKQYFNSSRLPELDLTEEDFERFGIGLGINVYSFVRFRMRKNIYYFHVSEHQCKLNLKIEKLFTLFTCLMIICTYDYYLLNLKAI